MLHRQLHQDVDGLLQLRRFGELRLRDLREGRLIVDREHVTAADKLHERLLIRPILALLFFRLQ